MLNHRQTKNQFESLTTLQAIQNQAYQMLVQGLVKTDFLMREWGILVSMKRSRLISSNNIIRFEIGNPLD